MTKPLYRLSPRDVQFYDKKMKALIHPQKNKIEKFIRYGCFVRINQDEYHCLPLEGYNKSEYILKRGPSGKFNCDCQGYAKRNDCSHVQALYIIIDDNAKQGCLF